MTRIIKYRLIVLVMMMWMATSQAQKNLLPESTPLSRTEQVSFDWQKSNKDFFTRMVQFSELSWASGPYMDHGSYKGAYILSADIQPGFFIGGERMRFAIHFSPRYKVRIFQNNKDFNDSSLPVRTPSFVPGATIYIPFNLGSPNVYKHMTYMSIAGFHHSNGQDHPTFDAPGEFNFYNGNFSTNYIEAGINRNWRFQKAQRMNFECKNQCNDFNTGYYGNDPYNIYYSKSYGFVRAGLALGFLVYTNRF